MDSDASETRRLLAEREVLRSILLGGLEACAGLEASTKSMNNDGLDGELPIGVRKRGYSGSRRW